MHCCARNIERLTRIPKLRTDLQSRFVSWLLLPFCQDLESFAHVLVAFFNICGCGKITVWNAPQLCTPEQAQRVEEPMVQWGAGLILVATLYRGMRRLT